MKIGCLAEKHTSLLCCPYREGVSEAIVKALVLVKMNNRSVKQGESISKSRDSVNYLETHERNLVVFLNREYMYYMFQALKWKKDQVENT